MRSDAAPNEWRASSLRLRIASYNIHRAVGRDNRRSPARIANVIGELRADIVGLQEVDWHPEPGGREPQFEYLDRVPGYESVLGPNIADHRGHYGNVLLTALPVTRERRLDLTERRREPRGAIDVDIDVQGGPLRVIVTHFGLSVRERWRQSVRLRHILLERPMQPTLILGDFNEWLPTSPTLRPLLSLCGQTANAASYPSKRPIFALDRILWRALPSSPANRVHRSPLAREASDHLPVLAEAEINASTASEVPRTEDQSALASNVNG